MRARAILPGLLLACLAISARAQPAPGATVSDQKVVVGRLPCLREEDPRSHGVRQLLWEMMKRTSAEAELETVAVEPADPSLFRTPFLLWSCQGAVAPLDQRALGNLQRFLVLGGFLWVDDPAAAPGGAFDQSVRATLAQLFPDKPLRAVPSDHVLFKTFFLIDRPFGRVAGESALSLDVGGRLAVVVTPNDVLGAASRDLYGNWDHQCTPGGEPQREMSIRLGINLVYYSLCQDYKDDRVHLPFILRRRKL
jgi:hypothetical protein